jgi:20S proteasome alpha/beta subunit
LDRDSSPPKVSVKVEVLRKLLQHVKEDLAVHIIIGGVDNDRSHVRVAVEDKAENDREIAAGGSGSAYLTG